MNNQNDDVKYYKNITGLKSAKQQISFTPEQIQEYVKCAENPIYFIENYVKIISSDKGPVLFKMYPYQKRIIQAVHNNRKILSRLSRQSGKCFINDTLLHLRNKKTGELVELTVGDLYWMELDRENFENET
jgi:hypothetical protein